MRAVVVAWRTVLAACGLVGFALDWSGLHFLSQLSSLVVFVYFGLTAVQGLLTRCRRVDPPDPYLRMMITATTWVVGIVFATLLSADYSSRQSLFMHAVVPIATLVDAVAVRGDLDRARWWHVALMPLPPLAYLVWALNQTPRPYSFLDPGSPKLVPTIIGALVGIWIAGALLLARGRVGRCRALAAS